MRLLRYSMFKTMLGKNRDSDAKLLKDADISVDSNPINDLVMRLNLSGSGIYTKDNWNVIDIAKNADLADIPAEKKRFSYNGHIYKLDSIDVLKSPINVNSYVFRFSDENKMFDATFINDKVTNLHVHEYVGPYSRTLNNVVKIKSLPLVDNHLNLYEKKIQEFAGEISALIDEKVMDYVRQSN